MPQIHSIPAVDILIKPNRQRIEENLDQVKIFELAASISDCGVIHPVTVRKADGELILVAGRRRIKAMEHLWFLRQDVRCAGRIFPEGEVPVVLLGDLDPIDAEEIELEENIRREDLSWKEKADAIHRLALLRLRQSERDKTPTPTVASIAEEVTGKSEGQFQENVRQDIILGRALQDPKKALVIEKASSREEAIKLLKRHEESQKNAALALSVGATFSAKMHSLFKGDCLEIMPTLPDSSFDVILSDPPYGIGADDFSDSGGKTAGGHFYDDSYDNWVKVIPVFARHATRLAKAEAHAYIFCDIDRFHELKGIFVSLGWKVFRTPMIAVNPGAVRAPWPEQGPQRKWQAILYAVRGNRLCTRLYGDVLQFGADPNLGHPAQKPVGLYTDLLRRSVRPGDSVLDPFCGSGVIFPAAHELKVKATGIEGDDSAYGISVKRLGALK